MAPRGRKPRPRHLQVLTGETRPYRKRPLGAQLPAIDGRVKPPAWLKGREARALWGELEEMLRTAGVLTTADLHALAHLCSAHQACVTEWRLGRTPPVAQQRELRAAFSEFGLTPSSRTRIPHREPKPKNAFGALGARA